MGCGRITFNEIIVYGAGAIGSAYGAFLSRMNKVTLIGRRKHLKAIKEKGLIISGDGAGTYAVATATKIEEIRPKTLLIVSVKAYDLQKSLTSIQSQIRKDTVLLLLQNGLGIEEIAQKAVKGRGTVLRGIVTTGAEVLEPGHIKIRKDITIFDANKRSQEIAKLLQSCNMSILISESFQTEKWRKLTINCVVNPLSAILQVRNHEIFTPQLIGVRQAIFEECVAVGAAEGVKLDSSLFQIIEENVPSYQNRSSMCQDLIRGKKTEIDFINGKVVELGKKHGISTPFNECLVQLIHFLESYEN